MFSTLPVLSLFLESLVYVLFFKNLNPQLFCPETKRSYMHTRTSIKLDEKVFNIDRIPSLPAQGLQGGQSRLEVSQGGEWTNPKLSATKVHLNIFQLKQLDLTFLLFIQIILPSKERLSSSLSSSTSSWFPESN